MSAPSFPGEFLSLQRDGASALHLQLADALRDLILSGRLRTGQRLPSIRSMAETQGISRNTVVAAFDQLSAEGYLESRPGAGIWVARLVPTGWPDRTMAAPAAGSFLSRRGALMAVQPRIRSIQGHPTFHPGTPETSSFPFKAWARLLKKHTSPHGSELLTYHNLNGLQALRENICAYVSASRGVRVTADRIVVTTGGQAALDLLARLLIDNGDKVLIEEPGYHGARSVFAAAGADVHPLPVTEAGWDLDAVTQKPVRVVYVTPSSQFPLGIAMTLQERLALIDHARAHGTWIIEDDYDSEYSFHARRLPALQGLIEDAPVIYLGTFSKTLFPALRIGYVILPENLSEQVKRAISFTGHYAPLFIQAALSDFMGEGHFLRHLNRMRRLYTQRRRYFLSLCQEHFGKVLKPLDYQSGIQITCVAADDFDDCAMAERARVHNLNPAPLSSYYHAGAARRGLVMGYAAVDEADMGSAFAALKAIL